MKKLLVWIILIVMLFTLSLPALAATKTRYRTLKRGFDGADVMKLKEAMYELGYFKTKNFAKTYNKTTEERVKELQRMNGLEPTGKADPALQELIYSGNCIPADGKPVKKAEAEKETAAAKEKETAKKETTKDTTEKVKEEPKEEPVEEPVEEPIEEPIEEPVEEIIEEVVEEIPLFYPDDMPERNEKGFLQPGMEDYSYQGEEEGLWLYLSTDLAVEIRRYEDTKDKNVWFECDVRTSETTPLMTFANWASYSKKGISAVSAIEYANRLQPVFAISDDMFAKRLWNDQPIGTVVRGGKLVSEGTLLDDEMAYPNLDTLALFADGSMLAEPNGTHTAKEYLDMGATDVFAHGPVLLHEGQPGALSVNKDYAHQRLARCAMGMIEPYHYFVLVTSGNDPEKAKGAYLEWLTERMSEKGVQEALNLGSESYVTLVFMGKRLNSTYNDNPMLFSAICVSKFLVPIM